MDIYFLCIHNCSKHHAPHVHGSFLIPPRNYHEELTHTGKNALNKNPALSVSYHLITPLQLKLLTLQQPYGRSTTTDISSTWAAPLLLLLFLFFFLHRLSFHRRRFRWNTKHELTLIASAYLISIVAREKGKKYIRKCIMHYTAVWVWGDMLQFKWCYTCNLMCIWW